MSENFQTFNFDNCTSEIFQTYAIIKMSETQKFICGCLSVCTSLRELTQSLQEF